jgi:hypothetical protein
MLLRSTLPCESLNAEEMLLLPLCLLSYEARDWTLCCGGFGGADALVLKHKNPN